MRPDFNKLLVERERIGHSRSYADVRNRKLAKGFDDTEVGGREGMKRRHNIAGNPKSFNENLNPLRGYLRSKIGKKWDKTYSELRQTFDARGVINNHILEHLYDYVEVNAVLIEGKAMVLGGRWNNRDYIPVAESYKDYYVCPKDGTLKKSTSKTYRQIRRERAEKEAKELLKTKRVLADGRELHLEDGVWFVLTFAQVPNCTARVQPRLVDQTYTYANKTWEQLTLLEKTRYGRVTDVKGDVVDADRRTRTRATSPVRIDGDIVLFKSSEKYCASKKTADRKTLREAGIDYVEAPEVKAMSHREHATYR